MSAFPSHFDPEESEVFVPWTDEMIDERIEEVLSSHINLRQDIGELMREMRDQYAEQITDLEYSCRSLAGALSDEEIDKHYEPPF